MSREHKPLRVRLRTNERVKRRGRARALRESAKSVEHATPRTRAKDHPGVAQWHLKEQARPSHGHDRHTNRREHAEDKLKYVAVHCETEAGEAGTFAQVHTELKSKLARAATEY